MRLAAGEGYATATDLADWLVRTLKMPFRDAHHVTGRIVTLAARQGVALHELPLAAMQEIEPVKSRTSFGGTAPKNVLAQAKGWLKRLEKQRK
jgi:argininosuccinate lyase